MNKEIVIIPESSPLHETFSEIAQHARLVVFSGLPGVGKSLYIREFERIARAQGKEISMIQWDVARKAFETDFIMQHFPMGAGTVHNGLKIMAGNWLMDYLKSWYPQVSDNELLIIEAPLVGHRFVELVHKNEDPGLEAFLASEKTRVLVPIPTKRVRTLIEEERARQVSEDAKVWSGAKPSVMKQLWQDTCAIANKFGMDIDLNGEVPYSDGIYEYVYAVILKHRHFEALLIDEIFEVPQEDESFLHKSDSIQASSVEADVYARQILEKYTSEEIDEITSNWYKT